MAIALSAERYRIVSDYLNPHWGYCGLVSVVNFKLKKYGNN